MAAEFSAPCVRTARRAAYAMFFADGIGFGIWAAQAVVVEKMLRATDYVFVPGALERRRSCWRLLKSATLSLGFTPVTNLVFVGSLIPY